MIPIHELKPFSQGGKRECYIHPDFPDRCIKIWRSGREPSTLRNQTSWLKKIRKKDRDFDENRNDWLALKGMEKFGDESIWDYIPRCYGYEETTRGPGLVIDLIRDYDGRISRTLLDHLWQSGDKEKFADSIHEFSQFWHTHYVPSRSLGLHNIVAKELSPQVFRLVLIDGFGNTLLLPFEKISRAYALRRSARKTMRIAHDVDILLEQRNRGDERCHRGILMSRT